MSNNSYYNQTMRTCISFPPVINDDSKILILGSMPGIISIEANQYYANKRNQFWKIIYNLFNEELSDVYEMKLNFIISHGIALWDVVKFCEREGSLDSNIKNPEINDFKRLLHNYPGIKTLFFNGSKSYDLFVRNMEQESNYPELIKLPSTSPAHAVTLEKKLEQWKNILEYI